MKYTFCFEGSCEVMGETLEEAKDNFWNMIYSMPKSEVEIQTIYYDKNETEED